MSTRKELDDVIESILHHYISEHYEHSMQVQTLADQIHSCLPKQLIYIDGQDIILHAAAGLHDIGWHLGQKKHNITSMNMIIGCELPGMSLAIRKLVALAARYHRKSLPVETDDYYCKLDDEFRNVVHIAAGILRIADALDNSHRSIVTVLQAEMPDRNTLNIKCAVNDDPQAETEAVKEKADLLEKLCKIKTKVKFVNVHNPLV